ncbi:hypothetical protein Sme01_72290 [Sphaerisporangium melleum]|uniref:Uncharacterized protein n=1 Tax=Sphaerisporangium melleum TaxID=321316 RepID=A0A917RQU0_9ACTN|nr:hypothetical protein GCM10007964_70470 [Sphaerisporangium melleum]GII74753.1 hypothetical protein Sme01_72290 [Sphaerisporangium melleum]
MALTCAETGTAPGPGHLARGWEATENGSVDDDRRAAAAAGDRWSRDRHRRAIVDFIAITDQDRLVIFATRTGNVRGRAAPLIARGAGPTRAMSRRTGAEPIGVPGAWMENAPESRRYAVLALTKYPYITPLLPGLKLGSAHIEGAPDPTPS